MKGHSVSTSFKKRACFEKLSACPELIEGTNGDRFKSLEISAHAGSLLLAYSMNRKRIHSRRRK